MDKILAFARKTIRLMLAWDRTTCVLASAFWLSFILFDINWCMMSTFQPFSHAPLYVSGTGLSLLLTLPYVLLRRRWPSYTLLVMLEILFVANLMYARTYLEAIPLRSYLIAGNLSEFMPSVWASLRWTDIPFLCIPIAAITMCRWPVRHNDYPDHMTPSCTNNSGVNDAKSHRKSRWTARTSVAGYLVWTAIPLAITVAAFPTPEDFRQHYAAFSSGAYSYRSGPAAYSLAGKLLYDHMTSRSGITPSQRRQTIDFMDSRPPVPALPHGVKPRRNLVVIMCESLESWPVGLVYEGHEITPVLNALVADSTTLYAPYTLSQAKGGRSMDGQLLIFSGMLPVSEGAYSTSYPSSAFPSLQQALKRDRKTRSFLFTGDKIKVWNQEQVARHLMIDTIISYPDYKLEEAFGGYRKHVGDRSFIRQTISKLKDGSTWRPGQPALVQMVTYSGHYPFRLPEKERDFTLSGKAPSLMEDYLYVTHFTDQALGAMINYLRGRPDWDDTMVVITGDHEGLAEHRASLASSPEGQGVVSTMPVVPFIVVNSPVGGHISHIVGQSDIYPTILQLLGLRDSAWRGFGRSMLDPDHPRCATDPWGRLYGTPADPSAPDTQREGWKHSDRALKFDLLRGTRYTAEK